MTTNPSRVRVRIEKAVLLYQAGIANVMATFEQSADYPRRLLQSTYRDCEMFARGLLAGGVQVEVKHCDEAGDVLLFEKEWTDGPGELWADKKSPPWSAFAAEPSDEVKAIEDSEPGGDLPDSGRTAS